MDRTLALTTMSYDKAVSESGRPEARSCRSEVRTLDPVQARRVFSECNRLLAAKQQAAAAEDTESAEPPLLARW